MREGFFIGFVLLLALIVVAAGYWFILQRVARFMDASLLQAFDNVFRPDLDKARLTHPRVNMIYRHLMRGSAKKGPNKEILPVTLIELKMPEEDFQFVQNNGGISEFTRQLSEHRHTLAMKKGWIDPTADPVPIKIAMSSELRRLRPRLVLTHVHSSDTRFISDPTPPAHTAPMNPFLASVQYRGKTWQLESSKSPYTFGRSADNHIQTAFDQISGRHGEFRFENGRWLVIPLKTLNATKVNGSPATAPTRIDHGDVITVGDSGPIRFEIVFNEAARERNTDSIPS